MAEKASSYRFGGFRLDPRRRSLERGDEALEIQPKVYEALLHFVRHPDRVVSKDELLRDVWGGAIVTEDVLTRVVSALRKVLGDEASSPRFIRAVRGFGYRFIATVEVDRPAAGEVTRPSSLAVLPFRAMSQADRDETLELGLADTMIARLGALADLIVRPLDSTLASMGDDRGALEVARVLDVDAVLDSSLQVSGAWLRVNARLLSAVDGKTLWSESFDEASAEAFQLQDAICNRIVAALLPRISGEDAGVASSGSGTPSGYREFLEGRLFMARHTAADVRRALECFECALDLSPTHAEAWASLGECHELIATEGEEDAEGHYELARRAARRALSLAPGLPEAEALLAKIAWQHDWDWEGAEAGFARAIARCPNRADLHVCYADFSCYVGRAAQGVEQARRAVELDPVSPWCNAILAQALYIDCRYDDAIGQSRRTLELAPGFAFAELFCGLAMFCGGEHAGGIESMERASRSGRRDIRAALGLCFGLDGQTEAAERIFAELANGAPPAPAIALAIAHLGCGQRREAAALLEQCIERRHWQVLLLCVDPVFATFRRDRRIGQILRKAGLPHGRSSADPAWQ